MLRPWHRYRFKASVWGDEIKTTTGILHARNRKDAHLLATAAAKRSATINKLKGDIDIFYLRKIGSDAH